MRSSLTVPLRRGGQAIGVLSLGRLKAGGYDASEIALVESFAEQASLAIASATTLRELRERTLDLQEALQQQTATAEVLEAINASPGDLAPVFNALLEKALRLCGGTIGGIFTIEGNRSVTRALHGVTPAFAAFQEQYPIDEIQPGSVPSRIIETRRPVQNPDVKPGETYRGGVPYARALVDLGNIRAVLAVPLLRIRGEIKESNCAKERRDRIANRLDATRNGGTGWLDDRHPRHPVPIQGASIAEGSTSFAPEPATMSHHHVTIPAIVG